MVGVDRLDDNGDVIVVGVGGVDGDGPGVARARFGFHVVDDGCVIIGGDQVDFDRGGAGMSLAGGQ